MWQHFGFRPLFSRLFSLHSQTMPTWLYLSTMTEGFIDYALNFLSIGVIPMKRTLSNREWTSFFMEPTVAHSNHGASTILKTLPHRSHSNLSVSCPHKLPMQVGSMHVISVRLSVKWLII